MGAEDVVEREEEVSQSIAKKWHSKRHHLTVAVIEADESDKRHIAVYGYAVQGDELAIGNAAGAKWLALTLAKAGIVLRGGK